MTTQILSAANAIAIGLCLALVLFVPFVYVNYRRRGTLTVRHTVAWVAVLVYLMAIWTFTLLPLPDPNAILYAAPQLVPFQFVTDFLAYDHSTLLAVLSNPVVWQVGLNLLLFTPLGFILARGLRARYSTIRAIGLASAVGFAVSLFIELTQLTGDWGVYAMPYRHFDVDDLMVNTAGALLGALTVAGWARLRRARRATRTFAVGEAVPASRLSLLPPSRRGTGRIGARPTARAQAIPVALGRRLLVMACDAIAVGLLLAATTFGLSRALDGTASAFAVAQWIVLALTCALTLTTGRTVGEVATRVRLLLPGTSSGAERWHSPALLLPRLLRFAAGIGGLQLLGIVNPVGYALGLLGVVFVFRSTGHRGLAGIMTGAPLVAQDGPHAGSEAQVSRQRGSDVSAGLGVVG